MREEIESDWKLIFHRHSSASKFEAPMFQEKEQVAINFKLIASFHLRVADILGDLHLLELE